MGFREGAFSYKYNRTSTIEMKEWVGSGMLDVLFFVFCVESFG